MHISQKSYLLFVVSFKHDRCYSISFLILVLNKNSILLSRRQLLEIMKSCVNSEFEKQYEFLREEINTITKSNMDEDHMEMANKILSHFKFHYKASWAKAYRMQDRFEQTYGSWLDALFQFPILKHNKVGLPDIPFSECLDRTKRSKVK